MTEYRNAYQLEAIIADMAGFDPQNIQVTKVGVGGDFRCDFVGTVGGVSSSRAKSDVEAACIRMREKYRLIQPCKHLVQCQEAQQTILRHHSGLQDPDHGRCPSGP